VDSVDSAHVEHRNGLHAGDASHTTNSPGAFHSMNSSPYGGGPFCLCAVVLPLEIRAFMGLCAYGRWCSFLSMLAFKHFLHLQNPFCVLTLTMHAAVLGVSRARTNDAIRKGNT
jgi:hypothetical protein